MEGLIDVTTGTDQNTPTPYPSTVRTRTALSERDLGLLVIRIGAGAVFIGHGSQKLFGAFNGAGLSGTAKFFESAGYGPARLLALLAGLAELGGGILLVLGLGASFAAAALIATMAGATSVAVDRGSGAFFAGNGGYEFELLLTVVAVGLTLTGAGRLALDKGRPWDSARVRLVLVAAGVFAGLVTTFAH